MTRAKWIFFPTRTTHSLCAWVAMAAGLAGYDWLAAQTTPVVRPFKVVRLDPALNAIISTDAKLDILGEHFGLTEGPVWMKEGNRGYLLFSDCAANVIYKWEEGAPLSVYLERSGYTGTDVLNVGQQTTAGRLAILLIGSNGLTLDPQGRLIITAMADRNVVRLEKNGARTLLADRYEGNRFSGPNDVAVKSDGGVYFIDSVNGLRGGADGPLRELFYNGVFLIKDGKVTLLDSDKNHPGEFPNGITFSPDEKRLYVTGGFGKTFRYDVQPDGTIANRELSIEAGNDGLKTDQQGNLYAVNAVGPGEVWIVSPAGKHLGTLQLPQITGEPRPRICATNLAFGDADNKNLFITACTHLFRVRLRAPGIRPGPQEYPAAGADEAPQFTALITWSSSSRMSKSPRPFTPSYSARR